jgi:glycosyltransferase involved in cell wall biosynthesis
MATYNGASHVAAQLNSILAQLGPHDEVIVVDDASTDSTVSVVKQLGDPRIALFHQARNVGYVKTFERALSHSRGRCIFLCDQDDVWPEGRAEVMLAALERGTVVCGNIAVLDGPPHITGPFGERNWRVNAQTSGHTARNLLRLAVSDMPYFGSAMAVSREALDDALPFPRSARELHDAWLALIGLTAGSMVHVDERVVLRRLHEDNTSGRMRSPWLVLHGRILFVRMAVVAWRRPRGARARARGRGPT